MIVMTAADLVKWVAWGATNIQSFWGMNNQGTNLYIQFHEVPPKADGTLAAGAVPTCKSFQVLPNAPFLFSNTNIPLAECFVAISTTEATYTAVAAAGGLDMSIVAQSDFLCDGTEVVVGDLTTTLNSVQIWAEAGGPKKLLRVDFVERHTMDGWLVIEATDADAAVPPGRVLSVKASVTTKFFFGPNGYQFFSQDASNYTLRQGCTLKSVYSATFPWVQVANSASIRAIYKP